MKMDFVFSQPVFTSSVRKTRANDNKLFVQTDCAFEQNIKAKIFNLLYANYFKFTSAGSLRSQHYMHIQYCLDYMQDIYWTFYNCNRLDIYSICMFKQVDSLKACVFNWQRYRQEWCLGRLQNAKLRNNWWSCRFSHGLNLFLEMYDIDVSRLSAGLAGLTRQDDDRFTDNLVAWPLDNSQRFCASPVMVDYGYGLCLVLLMSNLCGDFVSFFQYSWIFIFWCFSHVSLRGLRKWIWKSTVFDWILKLGFARVIFVLNFAAKVTGTGSSQLYSMNMVESGSIRNFSIRNIITRNKLLGFILRLLHGWTSVSAKHQNHSPPSALN